jgi:hypothetical protein
VRRQTLSRRQRAQIRHLGRQRLLPALQIRNPLLHLRHKISPIQRQLLRQQIVQHDLIPHLRRQRRIPAQLLDQLVQLLLAQRRAIFQIPMNQQI